MIRIFRSFIVILGSTILYLSLRNLNNQKKISIQSQNLLMFGPATAVFLVLGIINRDQFFIGVEYIIYIATSSLFFSFLGNYFSLASIKQAPNPGYSLMVSKSYVILTAVISLFLFNSPLHWSDIIAICFIIIFSGFLLIDKEKDSKMKGYGRIANAVYAFLARGGLALANKRFLNFGISPSVVNFWMFFFVSIYCIIDFVRIGGSLKDLPKINTGSLMVIFGMIIFNCGLMYGYQYSPNPGFISAANASSIAIITIFSSVFFGDDLSARKYIGIIGIIIGISILMIL